MDANATGSGIARTVVPRGNWVASLQRFAKTPPAARHTATELCELCAAPIAPRHQHLVEPNEGRMLCVCRNCALLLGHRRDGKFRAVPERGRILADFRLGDADWDSLGIPIGLAFFFQSTPQGRVLAFYPGSAGPTESLLKLDTWSQIVADNPELAGLAPDVEALLVNRINGARDYYCAPIDRCYALTGLIRSHWRGISGGARAWQAIDRFFAELDEDCGRPAKVRHG